MKKILQSTMEVFMKLITSFCKEYPSTLEEVLYLTPITDCYSDVAKSRLGMLHLGHKDLSQAALATVISS